MKELIISANEANQRFDKYLAKLLNEAPKGFYYKMLRKKNILLNGKKAAGTEKLKEGDSVKLFLSDETFDKFTSQKKVSRTSCNLDVIYEDEDVIFINKPSGMLSQKAKESDISLIDHLLSYLLENGSIHENELATFSPSICNRLDRNTSGLITAGKSLAGLQILSEWFHNRTVGKYYRCLVKGKVTKGQHVKGYLHKDEKSNQVKISEKAKDGSSYIETEYRPIAAGTDASLLEVHLITGKTHQIRAHLSYMGHPIIGDPKYGDIKTNQFFEKKYHLKSQLLHAYRLEIPEIEGKFSHLSDQKFIAPLPAIFEKICKDQGVM